MIHEIFFYVLMTCNFVNMIHIGMFTVGANLYDMRTFRRLSLEKKQMKAYKRKPLVSVVIAAHNEAPIITRTLDSVRASKYPNIEIIVIDDGSTDETAAVVRNYIRKLPQFKVASYIRRNSQTLLLKRRYVRADVGKMRMILVSQHNAGKGAALNNGIEHYVRGKFVMTLDADSLLQPNAITNAVRYFDDPNIIGVAANVRVIGSQGLVGTLQKFEHMIGYRSKKFYTLANCEFVVGGVASTYRTNILKEAKMYDTDTITEDIGLSLKLVALNGNRQMRIVYGSDVVAMTEGVQTFKALFRQRYRWKMGSLQNLIKYSYLLGNNDAKYSRMLTLYRLPMAVFGELLLLIEPLTLGYVVWLSFHYHTFSLAIGAYVTITLYVLWTIWPDEHMSNRDKIKMSLQSLGLYLLFYAMDTVQVTAIFRCLAHYKQITHRKQDQTWTSPARSVQVAAQV
jgi:cellulose synthase/poly-beta-1,6-N-acetylglucosamine synthase-like glycosyltransferase